MCPLKHIEEGGECLDWRPRTDGQVRRFDPGPVKTKIEIINLAALSNFDFSQRLDQSEGSSDLHRAAHVRLKRRAGPRPILSSKAALSQPKLPRAKAPKRMVSPVGAEIRGEGTPKADHAYLRNSETRWDETASNRKAVSMIQDRKTVRLGSARPIVGVDEMRHGLKAEEIRVGCRRVEDVGRERLPLRCRDADHGLPR